MLSPHALVLVCLMQVCTSNGSQAVAARSLSAADVANSTAFIASGCTQQQKSCNAVCTNTYIAADGAVKFLEDKAQTYVVEH